MDTETDRHTDNKNVTSPHTQVVIIQFPTANNSHLKNSMENAHPV